MDDSHEFESNLTHTKVGDFSQFDFFQPEYQFPIKPDDEEYLLFSDDVIFRSYHSLDEIIQKGWASSSYNPYPILLFNRETAEILDFRDGPQSGKGMHDVSYHILIDHMRADGKTGVQTWERDIDKALVKEYTWFKYSYRVQLTEFMKHGRNHFEFFGEYG